MSHWRPLPTWQELCALAFQIGVEKLSAMRGYRARWATAPKLMTLKAFVEYEEKYGELPSPSNLELAEEHWRKVRETEEGSDAHPDVLIERWEDEGGTIDPEPNPNPKGPPCDS